MKKATALILAIITSFLFIGCDFLSGTDDSILRAPNPGGELSEISSALDKHLSTDYTLKYAKSGELRSAFLIEDLDGDKRDEALVFYSVERNKDELLKISVFEKEDGEWKLDGEASIGGTDIEKLELGDVNGDGSMEAVVGWKIYNAPETRFSVFDLNGSIPLLIYEDSYSDFYLTDMDMDGREDILLCSLNPVSQIAEFKLLSHGKEGLAPISQLATEKGLTSVRRFTEQKTKNEKLIYIDAMNGTETYYTEIISYDGKNLRAPIFESSGQTSLLTKRYRDIPSGDVDSSGTIEIPCQTVLPGASTVEETLYLTEWKSYTSARLETVERSVVSRNQQFKFILNDKLREGFTAIATTGAEGICFCEYTKASQIGEKLFEIKSVDNAAFKESREQWISLASNEESAVVARLYEAAARRGITQADVIKGYSGSIIEKQSK